jgi:hypothetical protein
MRRLVSRQIERLVCESQKLCFLPKITKGDGFIMLKALAVISVFLTLIAYFCCVAAGDCDNENQDPGTIHKQ